MTATLTKPTSNTGTDSDIDHIYCCDLDLSLCGVDLSEVPVCDPLCGHPLCVVCHELDYVACEACGS